MRNKHTRATSTILFDAGNTLAFLDLERVGRVLQEHGVRADPARIQGAERAARAAMYRQAAAAPHLTDRGRWNIYMETMIQGIDSIASGEAVAAALEAAHRRENLWRRVGPGTPAVLDRLRAKGFRLGVVSNADGRVRALMRELRLASRFETIVDSHEVGVEKPDPRIFKVALAQLGVRPEHTAYVGDFPQVDVVGALRAGLHPVLLDPLGIADGVACDVITSLDELEALFA